MSWNVLGWIPRGPVKDDVPPGERCVHRARARHDATGCSARGRWGRWGRRCRGRGYTRFDSTMPFAPAPRSPVDR